MWHYFTDVLWLNDEEVRLGKKPRVNPLGLFLVTTWILLFAYVAFTSILPNRDRDRLLDLESRINKISEQARDNDFQLNKEATELDNALKDEYELAFNTARKENSNLTKKLQRLQNEFDQKNAEWKECRHPGSLDSHRD